MAGPKLPTRQASQLEAGSLIGLEGPCQVPNVGSHMEVTKTVPSHVGIL